MSTVSQAPVRRRVATDVERVGPGVAIDANVLNRFGHRLVVNTDLSRRAPAVFLSAEDQRVVGIVVYRRSCGRTTAQSEHSVAKKTAATENAEMRVLFGRRLFKQCGTCGVPHYIRIDYKCEEHVSDPVCKALCTTCGVKHRYPNVQNPYNTNDRRCTDNVFEGGEVRAVFCSHCHHMVWEVPGAPFECPGCFRPVVYETRTDKFACTMPTDSRKRPLPQGVLQERERKRRAIPGPHDPSTPIPAHAPVGPFQGLDAPFVYPFPGTAPAPAATDVAFPLPEHIPLPPVAAARTALNEYATPVAYAPETLPPDPLTAQAMEMDSEHRFTRVHDSSEAFFMPHAPEVPTPTLAREAPRDVLVRFFGSLLQAHDRGDYRTCLQSLAGQLELIMGDVRSGELEPSDDQVFWDELAATFIPLLTRGPLVRGPTRGPQFGGTRGAAGATKDEASLRKALESLPAAMRLRSLIETAHNQEDMSGSVEDDVSKEINELTATLDLLVVDDGFGGVSASCRKRSKGTTEWVDGDVFVRGDDWLGLTLRNEGERPIVVHCVDKHGKSKTVLEVDDTKYARIEPGMAASNAATSIQEANLRWVSDAAGTAANNICVAWRYDDEEREQAKWKVITLPYKVVVS